MATFFFQESDNDLFQLRSYEGLSSSTKNLIKLITISDETRPVGSYKYKIHKYPSDIDIFEKFSVCCDKETATKQIVEKLQAMVVEIDRHPLVFWGDFKAGIDMRIYQDPEYLTTSKACQNHLKNIQAYLTDKEYNQLAEHVSEPELFNDILRTYYTVRWSPVEVLNGKKQLRDNFELTLGQAINQNSLVKLDLLAPIDGSYNEITNFFIFEKHDKIGKKTVLNKELGDRKTSLLYDMVKYSGAEHYNPLKYIKRLWNWSIVTKNTELSKTVSPIFSSGIALMSQIVGELDAVSTLVKKYGIDKIPVNILRRQLETYKLKINNIHDVKVDENEFYVLLDRAILELVNAKDDQLIGTISELINNLNQTITLYADKFLKKNNLMNYLTV